MNDGGRRKRRDRRGGGGRKDPARRGAPPAGAASGGDAPQRFDGAPGEPAGDEVATRDPSAPPRDPFHRRPAFLGFPLSTSVANALLEVMRRTDGRGDGPGAARGVRWVSPVHLHVNTRHLGGVFLEHLKFLAEELADRVGAMERIPVRLGPFELWPDPARPRVIRAPVEADDGEVGALREVIDDVLAATDFDVPAHPADPHVTLAVLDDVAQPDELLQRVTTFRGAGSGRFWVSDLHLCVQYEPGAPYETYARIPLRRGRGGRRDDEADDGGPARAPVLYEKPILPTPRVEGGGRPVKPWDGPPRVPRDVLNAATAGGEAEPFEVTRRSPRSSGAKEGGAADGDGTDGASPADGQERQDPRRKAGEA